MTVPAWCPSAQRVPLGAGYDGCGAMAGGAPRAVHHTTEGSTAAGAEATYRDTHDYPHFTVDYARDVVRQHIPVTVGATALQNAKGGVQTNRQGSVCIQIEWVGQAAHPFTTDKDGHLIPAGPKVRGLLDFLRDHGIPGVWPEGAPIAYPASYGAANGERHPTIWTSKAGHYGHSQVPENHHGDPGALDPTFVRQTARHAPAKATATPAPAPAPAPSPSTTTTEDRMIVRFSSKPDVFEVVGSHLEHITPEAFHARAISPSTIKVVADDHPLAQLPRT